MRTRILLGVALLVGNELGAQAATTLLRKDARVRMWSSALGYAGTNGTIESRTADSLSVRVRFRSDAGRGGSEVRTVALSPVSTCTQELTFCRNVGGILVSVMFGGGLGGLVGAGIGGVLGVSIGALTSTHWVMVPLPR